MAGRGPAPNEQRRRRNVPVRGDWQPAPGLGWQHGDIPEPPDGLDRAAREAWQTWMRSWFASHWTPDDLPGLEVVIRLYDQCDLAFRDPTYCYEGEKKTVCINRPNPTTELRQMMDNYGITPKGQQDRRWQRPKATEPAPSAEQASNPQEDPYRHLRAVK